MSSAKPLRPNLQVPDLDQLTAPRPTSVNDPRFSAAEALETPEALERGLRNGNVRVVNPETVPQQHTRSEAAAPVSRRSPEISLSTKAPEYVMQQLRRRYAETGVTIRNQILLALRKDGIEVKADDLLDERKRSQRR